MLHIHFLVRLRHQHPWVLGNYGRALVGMLQYPLILSVSLCAKKKGSRESVKLTSTAPEPCVT